MLCTSNMFSGSLCNGNDLCSQNLSEAILRVGTLPTGCISLSFSVFLLRGSALSVGCILRAFWALWLAGHAGTCFCLFMLIWAHVGSRFRHLVPSQEWVKRRSADATPCWDKVKGTSADLGPDRAFMKDFSSDTGLCLISCRSRGPRPDRILGVWPMECSTLDSPIPTAGLKYLLSYGHN